MSQLLPLRSAVLPAPDQLLYDQVAGAASAVVIGHYSSSFGLASRLLRQPVRDHVRNLYALVRLADEIVDGSLARQRPERAATLLGRLEVETLEAMTDGYSVNLVVHAFASTARACAIDETLVTPFFASMRTDLTARSHDAVSFDRYVFGSAEVVGLMCLRVFLARAEHGRYDELAPGARRLGAAFQKVNFLRDMAEDHDARGRSYFPGIDPRRLTESDKHRLLDDIDADMAAAEPAIDGLPDGSRTAVAVARAVFVELAEQLRRTPAAEITRRRVRVSNGTKTRVALAALVRTRLA